MSILTPIADEIMPSGSGVESSWDCSRVDCVLFDFDRGRVVPCTWTDTVLDVVFREQQLLHEQLFQLIHFSFKVYRIFKNQR